MLFAQIGVVFVGIAGNHPEVVEHQLGPVLDHAGVTELAIPTGDLGVLARHGEASREIVRKLHVDGVIGGALIVANGAQTFRLVIYDGEGNLKSLGETPLVKKKLSKDDLEVLGINLDDEVAGLAKHHHDDVATVAPAPTPVAKPAPVAKLEPKPEPKAEPKPEPKAPIAVAVKPTVKTATAPAPVVDVLDREAPPGIASPPAEHHDAAPKETAEAVSMEDVEALTSGGNEAPAPVPSALSTLHLHANIGLGLAGRVFAAPASVTSYSSTPVGAVRFEAGVAPTARTSLEFAAERTLTMSTPLADGMATTTIERWEVAGAYTAVRGSIDVAPTIGVGHRAFSINSSDPSRSPDGDYSYLVLGARATKAVGNHLAVRGIVAFEPVLSGVEPTEMAFGEATRWAIDVGAAIELRPFAHVFARAAFDYQRFTWSWDGAGARGAGGATDSYPSGTLSLGAEY